jgi:AbrB family looped-hinge helix DNA binding protein
MRRSSETTTTIGGGGRIVIPAGYRKALDIAPGDEVILRLERDGLRIMTRSQAVRRAQGLVRRYAGKGRRVADELIAERRRESRE